MAKVGTTFGAPFFYGADLLDITAHIRSRYSNNKFYVDPERDEIDEEDEDVGFLPAFKLEKPLARQESSHGPLKWNTRRSQDMQEAIDMICVDEVCALECSFTMADPSMADCPLVACSVGFSSLTGYSISEIVGRNCRFLLNSVPAELIEDNTRMQCREFCQAISEGKYYDGAGTNPWVALMPGELLCVQVNARKSGELFRNMFYLKQVTLDDRSFIVGLQAGVPDLDDEDETHNLELRCQSSFRKLEENMGIVEQVLAAQFWYSAPMRRQC